MRKLCQIKHEVIDLSITSPKDCIGFVFLNDNGVYSILTDLEDIIKSHGYFGNKPVYLNLYCGDALIASTNKKTMLPGFSKEFLNEWIYNSNKNVYVEFTRTLIENDSTELLKINRDNEVTCYLTSIEIEKEVIVEKPLEEVNLKICANDFIRKCNVLGLVYAMEGGHIELNSILEDFAKSEEVKQYWSIQKS